MSKDATAKPLDNAGEAEVTMEELEQAPNSEVAPRLHEEGKEVAKKTREKVAPVTELHPEEGEADKDKPKRKKEKGNNETLELPTTEEILSAIPGFTSTKKLAEFRGICAKNHLIRIQGGGKKKTAVAVQGVEGSQAIADAFNTRFEELDKQAEEERVRTYEKRIEGIFGNIDEKGNDAQLRGYATKFLDSQLGVIKLESTGKKYHEWKVVAIEGKYGSDRIAKKVMAKKRELKEALFAKRRKEQRTQENRGALHEALKKATGR